MITKTTEGFQGSIKITQANAGGPRLSPMLPPNLALTAHATATSERSDQ